MMKAELIVGLSILLIVGVVFAYNEIKPPTMAYCEHMGYESELIDSGDEWVFLGNCIFDDGNKCEFNDFFYGECGEEYVKEIECREKGELVFDYFEGCCNNLKPSETTYILDQSRCEGSVVHFFKGILNWFRT